jgi:hypothetical protein
VCVNKVDISVFHCVAFSIEHVNLVANGTEPTLGPSDAPSLQCDFPLYKTNVLLTSYDV